VRICVMTKAQTVKRKQLLLIAIVSAYAEFASLKFFTPPLPWFVSARTKHGS
jgi:hypothetical protein